MLDVPGDFWAVQLIALSTKEDLEAYAERHNLHGMSAAQIANQEGEVFYILLLGIYESREIAEQAITELPKPFNNPWIRSVASLQSAMLRAEKVAGGKTD